MSKDANGQGSEVSEALSDERSSTEAQEEAEALLSRREKLDGESLQAVIHALLFVQGTPLSFARMKQVTLAAKSDIEAAIASLREHLDRDVSGLELVEVANGYQLRTKLAVQPYLTALRAAKPKKLSTQALETLAIVAYRQPIVKSDVEVIRGVDATPTIKTLLDRKLIKIVGYQDSVGHPALYGTTERFLELFGLESLRELPNLRELEAIEGDPGEIGESEIKEDELEENGEELSVERAKEHTPEENGEQAPSEQGALAVAS